MDRLQLPKKTDGVVQSIQYGYAGNCITAYLKKQNVVFRAKKDQAKSSVIIRNNTGIRKYNAKKLRARRQMETFINTEIGRLICTEKPGRIITTRQVVKGRTVFKNPKSNRIASRRFENYIRKRLGFKCLQNSIELIEINSSGTGSICSNCGAEGIRAITGFECLSCGYKASFAENGAKNIKKKYLEIYSGTLKDKTDIYMVNIPKPGDGVSITFTDIGQTAGVRN